MTRCSATPLGLNVGWLVTPGSAAKRVATRGYTPYPLRGKIENDLIENDLIENDLIENELIENELIENELIENELIEHELNESDLIRGNLFRDSLIRGNLVRCSFVLCDLVRCAEVLCWKGSLCFLILAEFCEDCEVFEGGCVAGGVAAGGDVAEEAAHDFA